MTTTAERRSVECPRCGAAIDVNDILYRQVEEGLRKTFEGRLADERKQMAERAAAARAEEEKRIRGAVERENAERLKAMEEELGRKSEQVRELHRTKTDLERLRREKEELRDALAAEFERKMSESLRGEREKLQKTAEERVRLKLSEKETVIEQLRVQLEEARRKAEQGSMQIQGEVQELAIEEWLKAAFPQDEIGEVKKGARGADCLHVVIGTDRRPCGSVYYESKRTKDFQPSWLPKFRADMREKGATIGVIVTEAMPKEMERMGMRDGVWICSFEEFKGLAAVLRDAVARIAQAAAAQENRGDKMTLLYSFLTGDEFRMQVEGIVEGFTQMQSDLHAERRAMESAWKKREKQLELVLLNTSHMYSAIRGIAGAAVAAVPLLEFPEEGSGGRGSDGRPRALPGG